MSSKEGRSYPYSIHRRSPILVQHSHSQHSCSGGHVQAMEENLKERKLAETICFIFEYNTVGTYLKFSLE